MEALREVNMSQGLPYNPQCTLYLGESDSGKSWAEYILYGAAIAVAGLNTAMAIRIADLQIDLAKLYLKIAKGWRNHYNSTYKPIENEERNEAGSFQKYTPNFDVAIGRSRTYARVQMGDNLERQMRCTSAYCTGARKGIMRDVAITEANALSSAMGMGYRNERAYAEARNDLIWNRKVDVVNRGRGLAANNVKFANLAFGIYGDLGNQARAGVTGALRYIGYENNRNDTVYPSVGRHVDEYVEPQTRSMRQVYPYVPLSVEDRKDAPYVGDTMRGGV